MNEQPAAEPVTAERLRGEHRPSEAIQDVVVDPHGTSHDDVVGGQHKAAHDPHNTPEHIRQETRVYIIVFVALGVLTAATVGACYGFHLPMNQAIAVAMFIACTKGFLVAGFFMHLLSEKKLIYSILLLTVVFFVVLILLPVFTVHGKIAY